jgi:protocatechuate 3,4-dioxygenase beta subunit
MDNAMTDHDPAAIGRILTRRELLARVGLSGAAILVGAAWARAAEAVPACVARPRQTEGPFVVDEPLERSDLRLDARTGAATPGVPLRLRFRVSELAGESCAPLSGARVDVWHCDAEGRYSDVVRAEAAAHFLRGYQLTDADGAAQFATIYPGWYAGRAVHVHFKIRVANGPGRARDFTSQLYFDDRLSERVFGSAPYAARGGRWLRNAQDGLYRDGGPQLTLAPIAEADGYAATFDVALAA